MKKIYKIVESLLQKRYMAILLMTIFFMSKASAQTDVLNCPAGTIVSNQMVFNTTNFTVVHAKASDANFASYSPWRVYTNNTVTFTGGADVQRITSIVIATETNAYATAAANGSLSITSGTGTVSGAASGSTVTLTVTGANAKGVMLDPTAQTRWTSITINYILNSNTLTYSGNTNTGGTAPAAVTAASTTLPAAGSLTKTGFIFSGWNTNAAGTGTNYNAGTTYTISSTHTLYARWAYSLGYNANGGTGAPAAATGYNAQTTTVSSTIPTRAGFIFTGWNSFANGSGTAYASGGSYAPGTTGSAVLYAQWRPAIVISEYMYQGLGAADVGEFIEFTNVSTVAVNMSGWSFSDNGRVIGEVSLSAFGTVQPGESVILTELPATTFRTNWNLCNAIKVIGDNVVNLGRSDEINLFTAANELADRLTYNDQGTGTVAGPRTNGASAWVPSTAAGNNTHNQWVPSITADSELSYASSLSEIGSPGISTLGTAAWVVCVAEMTVKGNNVIIADGDATPAATDHTLFGTSLCSVGGNVVRTFTIENSGDIALTIGTVTVTGNGFSLTQLPASTVNAINGSTSFQVTFNPAAAGVVSGNNNGSISIVNNDGTKNPYNFSISANVTIAVTPTVTIASNPAAVSGTITICAGNSVTFTATTANLGSGGTAAYQWKLNGGNVGGNTATYSNAALANGDVVRCDITVTGSCVTSATASSANITMQVNALPVTPNGEITPAQNPTCGPTTLTYEHGTGQPEAGITYYWQTAPAGVSTTNNVTSPLNITTGGNYYVRARNNTTGCWSSGSYVTQAPIVYGNPVNITTQPDDRTVTSPAGTTFTIAATNATGYQWQYYNGTAWVNLTNTAPYSGVTTAILTLASTTAAMDGNDYRCIVSANSPCAAVISADASLYINPGPCMAETVTSLASAGSYANRTWNGMGGVWEATDARSDLTINGRCVTIRNGTITSPTVTGGIGSITMTTELPYSDAAGNLTVRVNGNIVGTIPYSSSVVTTTIPNVNISGTVEVTISSPGARVSVDDITWSCYSSCTPTHTITSFTPASGPAGTRVTITGTGFSSITAVKFGEINAANYTVVNTSTIIAQAPVGAATNKIFVFSSTCPRGSVTNFTVLTNNGNCNSGGGAAPSDLMISEVFDSPSGSLGYVELFNGTTTTRSLNNYKLQVNSTAAITLSGSVGAGETIVFEYGSTGTRCGSNTYTNLSGSGFNEDDDIKLLNSSNTIIDRVITPSYTGYSYARTAAAGAPTATFTASQWTNTATACANIGSTNFVITPIITVNTQPTDKDCLQPIIFSVAATAVPNPVSSYRWMYNNPAVAGSGWLPVSGLTVTGVTFSGTNTATLSITGFTALIRNYQFYCELTKDLALDCIVQSNAAQYSYDSKLYYKANVVSGNWTTAGSWLMSDNASTGFVATCSYPVSFNCDAVIIPAGTKILHNANLLVDIDRITIEAGGELELGTGAGIRVLNAGTGADLIVNGTLTDNASSGAGNGIDYEDNTGTANDASWTLGSNGTIIKTNNSSAANYRDFYAGGISTIPATGNWIYRYIGTGTPAVVSADMYYPNLAFESASGHYNWNGATTALTGAANPMRVKGNLLIGASGSGTVKVFYNNINVLPMQIAGNLVVAAGDTLINTSYDNTITTTRGNGTGFDVKGDVTVNGTFTNNGGAANTGMLRFSGITTQNVTGTGTMNLENVDIANSGTAGTGVDVQRSFAIPGVLSFASGTPKLRLSSGIISLSSSAARTAQVAAVPANAISYGTGKFEVERYLPAVKAWRFLAAPVTGASSPTIRQSWQEGLTGISNFGTQLTGPQGTAAGFDGTSPSPAMKWYDMASNSYKPVNRTDTIIANPLGYMVFVRGDRNTSPSTPAASATNLRIQGQINTQTQAFTVNADAVQSLANPYPSAISFEAIASHSSNSTLQRSYTAWDPYLNMPNGNSVGGYQTITDIAGTYEAVPGGTVYYNDATSYPNIESGQTVYIKNSSLTAVLSGVINEGMKATGSRLASREPSLGDRQFIRTTVYNAAGMLTDGNLVAFDDELEDSIDVYDAVKFTNAGENFGLRRHGKTLAVEARGRLSENDTIFYRMSSMKEQAYRLKITGRNLASLNLQGIFVDQFMGTRTPLNFTDTNFITINVTSAAASKAADRFMIVFKSIAGPLPVNFVSVAAQRQADRSIAINWKVANEINIVKYEVERSANGSGFTAILSKDAAGVSQYAQTDLSPLAADNFYRIKAIGLAGDITYSNIVKVGGETVAASVVVTQVPVKNNQLSVKFTGQPAGNYNLQLSNALGQVMFKTKVAVNGSAELKLINLPKTVAAGTYHLNVRNSEGELMHGESIIIE